MKKRLALLLVLCLLLSGCTSPLEQLFFDWALSLSASTPITEATLKIWTPAEDQSEVSTWLPSMEAAFEAQHPEYNITWINEVCSEDSAAGMVTKDVAAAADVYLFSSQDLYDLIEADALLRLSGDYADQVRNDNSDLVTHTVTHADSNLYGFPVTNSTWFMYYNKEVFSESDLTSLETMLDKGKVAFPWCVGLYNGAFFLGNGGTVFGPKGNDEDAGIDFGGQNGYDTAEALVALAEYNTLLDDANERGLAALKSGVAGACFTSSANAQGLKDALGDKLGVALPPSFKVGTKSCQLKPFGSTKCVGINPKANDLDIATEFAAFLSSPDSQLKRYEMRGVIPASETLLENEAIAADPVAVTEITTMSEVAVVLPSLPGMDCYWDPMSDFFTDIMNAVITADNYKDALDELMAEMNPEDT